MLGVNQLDFINYCNALKGNYRKGVHKMETLLENPTHAKEFAKNLGGVSVVLGTPVGKEDRNSETLRSMLLSSDVANDAVYTWMGQYYEFDSWDELLGDEDRCKAMMANELLWRALSASGVAMGKTVATLAGLSCSAYDDMSAVAASSTAMAAVASSQTAMAAVINNSTALNAVVSSSTAMAAIEKSQVAKDAIAASDMATAKYAVGAAGLKPADYANMAAVAASQTAMAAVASSQTAMAAVASSQTAMTAIFRSSTALQVVQDNASAWAIFSNASSAVMGKTVAELAGLNPNSYADMNAIASSSTAMAAIIANSTALNAVVSSSAAMSAVAASQTAMTAVCSSALAFNAALKNSTARTQLAGSSYLQSNYDKLLSIIGNSTYFSQKFDNIDSGAKRAISGGNTDTTATANESVFLCKKIGAWSNGNSVTGTVAHLQTKTTAGSISTRAGGGQSTDDYTTGGVQAKYICIGGCTFTENGDAYCCGIFAFAK